MDFNTTHIQEQHISWLFRMALYTSWRKRGGRGIPERLFQYLEFCFLKESKLPTSIIADGIIIARLSVRVPFCLQDLSAVDKTFVPCSVVSHKR
jgi:hypothetical protein